MLHTGTTGATVMEGAARVFFDPPPDEGPHPGVRGKIRVDQLGVHLNPEVEWLIVGEPSEVGAEWSSTWTVIEFDHEVLLPWHRVWVIEWQE